MIVISLLLIVVAVVLLAAGLWQPSSSLLGGSIAASLLAAITLVVGAKRAATATREPAGDEDVVASPSGSGRVAVGGPRHQEPTAPPADPYHADQQHPGGRAEAVAPGTASVEPVTAVIPAQAEVEQEEAEYEDADPPDEPAPQVVSAADAARVAQMTAEVLVVDGRPRYHLPGCVHLLGREYEPLPVGEAIELGFTPCGLCEPDSALLADARRV